MYVNPSSASSAILVRSTGTLVPPALVPRPGQPLGIPMARRSPGIEVSMPVTEPLARWCALGRSSQLRPTERGFSLWFQLRGRTRLTAREGVFDLGPGEWLALERDSAPDLQAGAHAATLGLVLTGDAAGRSRPDLLPGHGRMTSRDLRIALRLWRNAQRLATLAGRDPLQAQRALQSLLMHLAAQQRGMETAIARCPGRSVRRKRQVFGRMQRARLYLEGNRHRVVRLSELAELTSFSSWYLSKTFHSIYDESPQAASVRLRLERACELLEKSDCAIGEVGAACGFDNSCSFARAFRARFRVTASAYRESVRANRQARD